MTQHARPTADVAYINWSNHAGAPVDLWAELDEAVADPADFIESIAAPTNEHYVAKLSTLADPGTDSGHVARIQARKQTVGGSRLDLVAQVRQGYVDEALQGDLISEFHLDDLSETATIVEYPLPSAEAVLITDYASLHARVVANQPYQDKTVAALRNATGPGCGPGTHETLDWSFGATAVLKRLTGSGDSWAMVEAAKTIKAGAWSVALYYDSASGGGPQNAIRAVVKILNPDCTLKQTVLDQTILVAKGQSGTLATASQSAGAVVLSAGDIVSLAVSKAAGNQAVTLRYGGTVPQKAASKVTNPGGTVVNSIAEVSWFEMETP